MLDIILDKNFALTSDEFNFRLERRNVVATGKKAGQEARTIIGYYGRLDFALEAYVHKALKLSDAKTVKELMDQVLAVQEVVNKVGKDFMEKFPRPAYKEKA